MNQIANRIAARRIWLKLSQEELAGIAGTTQKQISRFETGKHAPSADMLVALANALDTTTDWLLGLVDAPMRSSNSISDLNDDERQLIELYRQKPPDKRHQIIDVARVL